MIDINKYVQDHTYDLDIQRQIVVSPDNLEQLNLRSYGHHRTYTDNLPQ